MKRAEGRVIGRLVLVLDRDAIFADRRRGVSIGQIARAHRISKTSVRRVLQRDPAAIKEKVVA